MTDHRSDEELVAAVIKGEDGAFRSLVHRYQSPLINYLYRFLNDREMAEEATQETFMAVFQNIEKLRKDTSFRAWIYAIATNRASRLLRKRAPIYDGGVLDNFQANAVDPMKNASEKERSLAVQKALTTLPERHRAIFILRFYQGLSYEEVANTVGCPLGTVKSRMCYALKKLRGILWSHREDGDIDNHGMQ